MCWKFRLEFGCVYWAKQEHTRHATSTHDHYAILQALSIPSSPETPVCSWKSSWCPWILFSSRTPSREPRQLCTVLSRRGSNPSADATSPTALREISTTRPRMTQQPRSCGSSARDSVVSPEELWIKSCLSVFIPDYNSGLARQSTRHMLGFFFTVLLTLSLHKNEFKHSVTSVLQLFFPLRCLTHHCFCCTVQINSLYVDLRDGFLHEHTLYHSTWTFSGLAGLDWEGCVIFFKGY